MHDIQGPKNHRPVPDTSTDRFGSYPPSFQCIVLVGLVGVGTRRVEIYKAIREVL